MQYLLIHLKSALATRDSVSDDLAFAVNQINALFWLLHTLLQSHFHWWGSSGHSAPLEDLNEELIMDLL
jgi:hypothetical protein